MNAPLDRRRFVQQTSGLLLGGTALAALTARADDPGKTIRKAAGWNMIRADLSVEDKLRMVKDVGFAGVEVPAVQPDRPSFDPKELARASEKVGVAVHGVTMAGHPDLTAVINQAAMYGATSVLYVVRADANAPFMEHYRQTQDMIRAGVPLAEKKQIPILIENVWASFLIEPLTMARYIDEFDSPYVAAYFDVGNVMRWGWPQHWIEVLGKRVRKIHIKEYSLKIAMNQGMYKGFDVPIGEGDIDWARVREELKKIDFNDWATAEVRGGGRERLAEISAEMDRVLAL